MIYKEVAIGRAANCEIHLPEECKYASSHHAIIFNRGTQLMFRDESTNGTIVNNVRVHHSVTPIRLGDSILIAGRYPLRWNVILRFFPMDYLHQSPPQSEAYMNNAVILHSPSSPTQETVAYTEPQSLDEFNWGAFFLYPIWGFWNGCWWAFFVNLFTGSLFLIPNLVFGIYGNRWSWENKRWDSPARFESAQHSWAVWGIVLTFISIFSFIVLFIVFFSLFLEIINTPVSSENPFYWS